MIQTNRFWKFVILSLACITIGITILSVVIWLNLTIAERNVLIQISQKNIYTLLGLGFIVAGAFWAVFDITYNRYIRPLKRMSAEAEMIYSSNPSHRIEVNGSGDVKRMAEVINDFADMFENLNKTITEQILAARKETEKERNLLAAIMGELPQGVIVCNKNGRIILFNSLAKDLFSSSSGTELSEQFIGLGRSIFHLIDKSLVAHAMDEIIEQINTPESTLGSYFITPIATGTLISAEALPLLDPDKKFTGFILAVQDVSNGIKKYQTIDKYLEQCKAIIGSSVNSNKFDAILPEFEQMAADILDASFSSLPLTSLSLETFLPAIQKKTAFTQNIRVNIFNPNSSISILGDTYSMTQGFLSVFEHLSKFTQLDEFDLTVSVTFQKSLEFEITWQGTGFNCNKIETMLKNRLHGLPSLGYILKFNNAGLTPITRDDSICTGVNISARIGFISRNRIKKAPPILSDSRPEFYDFNLFGLSGSTANLLDTPLKDLTYTVFDTETTGLNPDGGDEIISIGAVRVVNQRVVYQEFFEELVNPGRDIPIESYKIHGINYEMVKEREDIKAILPRFKTFAGKTVLLGHNIAFDMKMLKVKENYTGIQFNNPVLDTLLLSAILHPVHEQHDMENIARRLGVNILGRHTALGDAITTAEIYLKLLPILNSNGILTLKDAISASKKTYYARLKY
ncbi:MAG: hypothetical protein MI892_26345 [Desulfobacterales bacterium]|nr:hypothetical protein [Desulfobacterales bacterium]